MSSCYLGLGSNLRSPERQLRNALKKIKNIPRTKIQVSSKIISSKPHGTSWQPYYCNMVVCLKTRLQPIKLLDHCQKIELQQKRIRKKRWGPRTLDIDILLYGNTELNSKRLTIPHPRMHERDFVLIPLKEINKFILN